MGAWGPNAFENDAACDWADQLRDEPGLPFITETLARVLESEHEFLDADCGSEALAACEVVARLKGNWGPQTPDSKAADAWVRTQAIKPDAQLIALAEQAIERLLGENSELFELWDGADEWTAAIADLQRRLRA